jgi:hypothetical protein
LSTHKSEPGLVLGPDEIKELADFVRSFQPEDLEQLRSFARDWRPEDLADLRMLIRELPSEKRKKLSNMEEEWGHYTWTGGFIVRGSAYSAGVIGALWIGRDMIARIFKAVFNAP